MEVDNGLRGHEALTDDNGVALALQQLLQAPGGALFHGVAVADQVRVLRQSAVGHGLLIGGDPLHGGGQPGQSADDADAAVPLAGQTADGAVNGLEVGHADGGVLLGLKGTVHQHHRESGGNQLVKALEIIHGTGDQQPVHQSGGQQPDVGLLPVHVLLGVGDNQLIAVGGEVVLHRLDHGGKELVGNIGHNKADGPLFAGAETAGRGIGGVAQLRNGLVDLLLGLTGDIAGVVDGVGHGGGGDPGQPGHIGNGDFHGSHPSLRNGGFPCVNN